MSTIPKQVQAQADKADELLKKASEGEKPLVTDPTNPPEDPGKKPPEAPVAEETVESLKQKLSEAEQKYSVLQGKYNSEIQALKDDVNLLNTLKNQNRQLTGQVQDLNGKLNEANVTIGELRKQVSEKTKDPVVEDAKVLTLLKDEDKEYLKGEGFDEKTIEIFGNIVNTLVSKRTPQPSNASDKETLEDIQRKMREKEDRTFWKELEAKVPDWESINGNPRNGMQMLPEFDAWLDVRIPYSDQTRRDRMIAAQDVLDYETVIKIFNDFKAENPATRLKKPEPKVDPEKQIDPASSVSHEQHPDGAHPAGKIYTRQEVKEFYDGFTKGLWKGKEDEFDKKDREIIKAHQEGRVRG